MATNNRRNAGMPPSSRTPAAKKPPANVKRQEVQAAVGEPESDDAARKAIFAANLPMFRAVVRGNVVANGETFTSKAGETYYTFRIAYNRMRNGEKHVMFIKVLQKEDPNTTEPPVGKGQYVEVSGDYSDDGVTPGLNGYGPSVFRTIFVGPDDSVKVLIG